MSNAAALKALHGDASADADEEAGLLRLSVDTDGDADGDGDGDGSDGTERDSASSPKPANGHSHAHRPRRYEQRGDDSEQQRPQQRVSTALCCLCVALPYLLLAALVALILSGSPLVSSASRAATSAAAAAEHSATAAPSGLSGPSDRFAAAALAPAAANDSAAPAASSTAAAAVAAACPPLPPPVVCPAPSPPPSNGHAANASDAAGPGKDAECPFAEPPFVHNWAGGVWGREQYDDWLQRKPGDDPRASRLYPRQNDQSISVPAAAEEGGRLSVSQMQVVVATAAIYHRKRGDVLMASWASQVPAGRIHMYSDGEETAQQLPVVYFPHTPGPPNASANEPPHPFSQYYTLAGSDDHDPYFKAQVRFLQGMQHSFPLMLADPLVRWLLVVDDDTFVFWPNLLAVAAQYNSSQPHSLGNTLLRDKGKAHNAGGAGWLLSRGAVDAMKDRIAQCYLPLWAPRDDHWVWYDLHVVRCFMDLLDLTTDNREEMEELNPRYFTAPPPEPDTRHPTDLIWRRRSGKVRGATFHYMKAHEMMAAHNLGMLLGCGQ